MAGSADVVDFSSQLYYVAVIFEFYGKLLIWIERTAAVHRPSQEAIILHFLLLEVCSE